MGTTTATAIVPAELMPLLEVVLDCPLDVRAELDVAEAESAVFALGVLTIVFVTTCVLVDPSEVMMDVATDSVVVGSGVEVGVVGVDEVVEGVDVLESWLVVD